MISKKKLLLKTIIITLILCVIGLLYLFRSPPELSSDITLLNLFTNLNLGVQFEIREFASEKTALKNNLKKSFFEKITSKKFMGKVDHALSKHCFLFNKTLAHQTAFAASADGKNFAAVTRLTNLSSFIYAVADTTGYIEKVEKPFKDNGKNIYFNNDSTFLYLASDQDLLNKIICRNKEQLKINENIYNGIYSRITLTDSLRGRMSRDSVTGLHDVEKITFNIINKLDKIKLVTEIKLTKTASRYLKNVANDLKIERPLAFKDFNTFEESQLSISGNLEPKILWHILNRKIFGSHARPAVSTSLPETVIYWNLVNNGLVNHCSGGLYLNIGKAVEFKDSLPCPEIQ
ncbi:MAG: hypothetical protein ACYTFY_14635, partial [Planctomycetota bacterium]